MFIKKQIPIQEALDINEGISGIKTSQYIEERSRNMLKAVTANKLNLFQEKVEGIVKKFKETYENTFKKFAPEGVTELKPELHNDIIKEFNAEIEEVKRQMIEVEVLADKISIERELGNFECHSHALFLLKNYIE